MRALKRLRLMVFAELVVQTAMTVAPPRVCVLMAGLSWVLWLLMHHRCAAPPSQSPISLTQARWSCKPAINMTLHIHPPHILNTKLRLGRFPSLTYSPIPHPSKQKKKKTYWTLNRVAIPTKKGNSFQGFHTLKKINTTPRNPITSTPPQCHTPTPPSPSVLETGGLGLLPRLAEVSLG